MTGYVQAMLNEKMNFKECIMKCAEAFVPDCRYGAIALSIDVQMHSIYTDDVQHYTNKIAELTQLSESEKEAFGKKLRDEEIQDYYDNAAEYDRNIDTIMIRRKQVEDWQPPTEKHEPLKKYVLDQMDSALDDLRNYRKYNLESMEEIKKKSPMEVFDIHLKTYTNGHINALAALHKERERINNLNLWLSQLRDSLK